MIKLMIFIYSFNLPEITSANIASITRIPLLSSKRNIKTSKHVTNKETQIGILKS